MFKQLALLPGLLLGVSSAFAQGQPANSASVADVALLAKIRHDYDTPFKRNLASFNCSVEFDWKQHVIDVVGKVPEPLVPSIDALQKVKHRVSVDYSHAALTTLPGYPDLSGVAHGQDLEGSFTGIVTAGLNAWVPSAADLLLPSGPTHYSFTKLDSGYELAMSGPGVAAKLLLSDDLRMTNGVSQQPQPLRFNTSFTNGPEGFLLGSMQTSDTASMGHDAEFDYSYADIEGFQLPTGVTVKSATGETWHYSLRDCKVVKFVKLKVQTLPLKPQ
ncbi:hypothetical protein [Silvibacterium sp.]|uniref:hypothetical protein n=1 Tax=Silvibacterium sp. TaxID=1964179 RepID=UPI0039E32328